MTRKQVRHDGLVALGALALGVWLGVTVGLATRARRRTSQDVS